MLVICSRSKLVVSEKIHNVNTYLTIKDFENYKKSYHARNDNAMPSSTFFIFVGSLYEGVEIPQSHKQTGY